MLLEAAHLDIAYGDAPAVRDVSLAVAADEIVSIVGPNGAGKTTLINTIAGLMRPRAGELRIAGTDLTKVPAHDFCRHGIALVPEARRLFASMTVEENLDIGCYRAAARKVRRESLDLVFGIFPVLRERRRETAGVLSGGQQQMVAIGRALMAKPVLLLLDEPSLGLAPSVVDAVFEAIARIRQTGVAILLVEQNVAKALEIATRTYVLDRGGIVASGASRELFARPEISEAYLGL
jgi:branched-chain amino acid transport system ATP-binding protein